MHAFIHTSSFVSLCSATGYRSIWTLSRLAMDTHMFFYIVAWFTYNIYYMLTQYHICSYLSEGVPATVLEIISHQGKRSRPKTHRQMPSQLQKTRQFRRIRAVNRQAASDESAIWSWKSCFIKIVTIISRVHKWLSTS